MKSMWERGEGEEGEVANMGTLFNNDFRLHSHRSKPELSKEDSDLQNKLEEVSGLAVGMMSWDDYMYVSLEWSGSEWSM